MTSRIYLAAFAVGLALVGYGLVGCEDDAEVVNSITCGDVCERYQECIDEDFDIVACTDGCEANASAVTAQEQRLEDCDACLNGVSCEEGVFMCTNRCVGVIDTNQ